MENQQISEQSSVLQPAKLGAQPLPTAADFVRPGNHLTENEANRVGIESAASISSTRPATNESIDLDLQVLSGKVEIIEEGLAELRQSYLDFVDHVIRTLEHLTSGGTGAPSVSPLAERITFVENLLKANGHRNAFGDAEALKSA